jgi:hypothetical protein
MSLKKFIILALSGVIPVAIFMRLPMGTWADFSALPGHPLIVHGVIVAIPVAAIWTILAVWKPSILKRTYIPLWALCIAGTLGVIAAKSSGDSLAAAVGLPNSHADAGNRMIPVMIAMSLTVLGFIFFHLVRPVRVVNHGTRALAALAAVLSLPMTYIAGHSGAESVWEEEYAEAQQPISTGNLVLTMSEVQQRNTDDACWTVVDGIVYDMTTFIARHPAGANDIKDMCGKDATDDFLGEHEGQGEPEKWLATLRIGVVE